LEEIIHKQTRDIQTLKCELLNEREKFTLNQKETELTYSQKINDLLNKLNENEIEKRKQIEISEQKIEKLSKENQLLTNQQIQYAQTLKEEKDRLSDKHTVDLKELNQKLEQIKLENNKQNELKELKIKQLSDENSKYLNELQSLRNYVNDSMPTIDTVKQMNKEKEKFNEQIDQIKSKNDSLQKENSALQTRLKSINEILIIQENQLEHSSSSPSAKTSYLTNEKKRQGLLNKWRMKVFELLIQLKSLEINNKQDKNMSEKTLLEYIERLEDASNRNKILENVIEDKKAEICVLNNDNTRIIEQLSILKETNESLEKKSQQDLQSSIELKNFVNSLIKQYQLIENSFKSANKKLSHLDQRVEFAKNRLCVIKALYTKKETNTNEDELKRGNVLDMTSYLSSIHSSIDQNQSNFNHQPVIVENTKINNNNNNNKFDKDEEAMLRQELEKVSEERDLLANKLKNEMKTIDDKVIKMKTDYEFKIDSLNLRLTELNDLNEMKDSQLEKLNEQYLIKESLNQDLTKRYDNLQLQHTELRTQITNDFDKQMKLRELEFADKIQSLDEKLNEARREQSKAVVIMRQMERSTNREKERLESLLKSCDSYYKSHLDKLQAKLNSLEKERNNLINNLRNNGHLPSINSLENEEYSLKNNQQTSTMNYNKNLSNNIEITSFWLDSKQSLEEPTSQTNVNNEEEEEEGGDEEIYKQQFSNNDDDDDALNESDSNKNTEILNQIRKIMGNLELSDVELDNNETSEQKYDYETTTNDENQYDYEIEHVIDDENLYKHKN